jgi:hypothetical protein
MLHWCKPCRSEQFSPSNYNVTHHNCHRSVRSMISCRAFHNRPTLTLNHCVWTRSSLTWVLRGKRRGGRGLPAAREIPDCGAEGAQEKSGLDSPCMTRIYTRSYGLVVMFPQLEWKLLFKISLTIRYSTLLGSISLRWSASIQSHWSEEWLNQLV